MRNYKFQLYIDKNKEFRFRIISPNGKIVADSGEGYKTKAKCVKNIKKLKEKIVDAEILET